MKHILIAIMAVCCLIGCRKKENITEATTHLTVNIISPTVGATFKKGDTVLVKAHITNDVSLHGYEVKVLNTSQNSVVFDSASHSHAADIQVQYRFVATGDSVANWTIQLITTLDHSSDPIITERLCTYRP